LLHHLPVPLPRHFQVQGGGAVSQARPLPGPGPGARVPLLPGPLAGQGPRGLLAVPGRQAGARALAEYHLHQTTH